MNKILIKLTAVGCVDSTVTQYFSKPRTLLLNTYKILKIMVNNRGVTEVTDESGRNTFYVQETPEEIYNLITKE